MQRLTGVLLVNLGTPDSPHPSDVKTYLHEFLTDNRVIDKAWLWRQFLVRGVIVPKRYKQSAASYAHIWTEEGSPLMIYSKRQKSLLQQELGPQFHVELAMRYRHPSLSTALSNLLNKPLDRLVVFPLFPQYASATTGSVHQRVMQLLQEYPTIPQTTFVPHFADHHAFIDAFAARASSYTLRDYDHILFSYHGLPEQQIKKADRGSSCLRTRDCCDVSSANNKMCYSAQCFATTRALVKKLNLSLHQYSICFQSRLGKAPWLQPYASEVIHELARQGKKKVLVFCPSFVCDCLETIYEFGVEYAQEFKQGGGERLDLVSGLNDHPQWIASLAKMVREI